MKEGDQVLVRNMREKGGTGKLRSHWEKAVFEIVKKKDNLPVYIIENVRNKKDNRTVHRNMLMECNDLPSDVFEENDQGKRKVKVKNMEKKKIEENVDEIPNEEMDDIAVFVHEDMVGSSLRGGDGVLENVAETPEADVVFDDALEPDILDPGVLEPDLVSDSDHEDDSGDDLHDPEPKSVRKSVHFIRAPKIFSYDEIGGPPVLIDVKNKK